MTWLRTFWSTLMSTLRDLCYHYEVRIVYRNGNEVVHARIQARTSAEDRAKQLRAVPGNALATVTIVRQRGLHPWTGRIIGIPILLVATIVVEPMPVRVSITSVVTVVLLTRGGGGIEWMKGGRDDR
jgi:hypothetical protein